MERNFVLSCLQFFFVPTNEQEEDIFNGACFIFSPLKKSNTNNHRNGSSVYHIADL